MSMRYVLDKTDLKTGRSSMRRKPITYGSILKISRHAMLYSSAGKISNQVKRRLSDAPISAK